MKKGGRCIAETAQSAQEHNNVMPGYLHARWGQTGPRHTQTPLTPRSVGAPRASGGRERRRTNSAEIPKQPTDGLLCAWGTFRTQPRPFHNPLTHLTEQLQSDAAAGPRPPSAMEERRLRALHSNHHPVPVSPSTQTLQRRYTNK